MKNRILAGWRASMAGATLAIATLLGAALPTVAAYAATAVTNTTASYNTATQMIDVSWTPTGIAGDTYIITVGFGGPSYSPALDSSNAELTGLTGSSAHIARYDAAGTPTDLTAGQDVYVRVTTVSSDSSTAQSDAPAVTVGATSAQQPTNVAVTYNSTTGALDVNGTPGSPTDNIAYSIRVHGSADWLEVRLSGTGSNISTLPASITGVVSDTSTTPRTYTDLVPGQSYDIQLVASNGGGSAPAVVVSNVLFGSSDTTGNTNTPTVPDTGFTFGLASPVAVIGIGTMAAIVIAIAGKKLARR